MNLEMSPQETEFLKEVLGSYMLDMHSEIVHTDNFELKEHLKFKRDTLKGILSKLQEIESVPG